MTKKEREKQKQIQSLAQLHGFKKARQIYAQEHPDEEEKEKERGKTRRKRWERKEPKVWENSVTQKVSDHCVLFLFFDKIF